MKSRRIGLALAFAGLISAIFAYLLIKYNQDQINLGRTPPFETAAIGTQASALLQLSLPDADGRIQALEQWRGKILVVNYWATWCPPCREEMPGFSRLQDKLGGKGVQFVGISIDTAAKVSEFQKQTPVNYPLLIGDAGAIDVSVALGNSQQALPFTAVIDRQGKVSSIKLGRFPEADLDRLLTKLIEG